MSVSNLSLPVAFGCDLAGFEYKTGVAAWLNQQGYQLSDFGTYSDAFADYPDFAHPTASSVEKGDTAFVFLICGSGNRVSITANKQAGIRAGFCRVTDIAKLVRQPNNAPIICIPARFVWLKLARDMIIHFMTTAFEAGRHQSRINKISC